MHEVSAHESNEFEEAVFGLRYLLQEVQEQKGDQGYGDLNANGILGTADEVGDLQGLLHGAEEQLNLPATLVEIGDLLCRSIEIIAEDTQLLAGLGHHHDLPYRNLHWVLAAAGLTGRQEADAVAQYSRSRKQRLPLGLTERGVGLEAGDGGAARLLSHSPP